MPLSQEQRTALEKAARENGVDPAELIAAAEREMEQEDKGDKEKGGPTIDATPSAEPPKLFQYHLPFLTVRELRERLGLTDPFPGDSEVAAAWAMRFAAPATGDKPPDEAA